MAHALANATRSKPLNGDFAIRHGSAFVNEYARKDPSTGLRFDGGADNPSHLLGAFPCLFPYGRGGFELQRPVDVSYDSHARWALQYYDKRFRLDIHFVFQVFGVIQKRQVCRSATLQIGHDAARSQSDLLATLTPDVLLKASQEETARQPHSNPAVRSLKGHLKALRRRVQGTDESRFVVRSYVWGASLSTLR